MKKTESVHGASIEKGEDGSAQVRTAGGATIDISNERNVELNIETIQSVGIYDLSEVEGHLINQVLGSTSHLVRFHGGGELRFAYNQQGKLIELSASNCGFVLSNSNELLFRAKAKAG
jgi:hypothetical protein